MSETIAPAINSIILAGLYQYYWAIICLAGLLAGAYALRKAYSVSIVFVGGYRVGVAES